MSESDPSTSQSTMLQQWQTLKQQAESGELHMDTDVGASLAARCDVFKDRLQTMLRQADSLGYLEGFGSLRSAEKLQAKFAGKAVTDPDSATNRLKAAIDIVTLMKQTFELSARRIEETDQSTSTALGNAGA